jgi:splicing factor 3B subunit 3
MRADEDNRIFQIPKLGTKLKQDALPLSFTPRKLIQHPTNRYFYLIEGDHRTYSDEAVKQKVDDLVSGSILDSRRLSLNITQRRSGKMVDESALELPPAEFGRARAPAGMWASCIRIVDPVEARTVALFPLDNNESAFSVAVVPFAARNNELHLVVGTAQDTKLVPKTCTSGFLRTYAFKNDGTGLELLHKVWLDALCAHDTRSSVLIDGDGRCAPRHYGIPGQTLRRYR